MRRGNPFLEYHAIAPFRLGPIERHVGMMHQALQMGAMRRNTETDGQRTRYILLYEGTGHHRLTQLFRKHASGLHSGIRQQNCKFLAANPAAQIGFSQ